MRKKYPYLEQITSKKYYHKKKNTRAILDISCQLTYRIHPVVTLVFQKMRICMKVASNKQINNGEVKKKKKKKGQ